MNRIILPIIITSSFLTACGGGAGGDSVTTSDGSTHSTSDRVLTGGISKLPATVKLTCKSTTTAKGKEEDITMTTESGAQGNIEARCGQNDFVVKEGIPSLNIKAAKVIDYWFCTNAKGGSLYGFMHTQDLTKGSMQSVIVQQIKIQRLAVVMLV